MLKLDFTKQEYEELIEKLMLDEELSEILKMRIQNKSITQMSMKLNLSESTVKRRIKKLKNKIKRAI